MNLAILMQYITNAVICRVMRSAVCDNTPVQQQKLISLLLPLKAICWRLQTMTVV